MDPDCGELIKEIRFGSRLIRAPAKRIYANRHVFRLELPPTPILDWLLSWIPRCVRLRLKRLLPEWFLPSSIILKERNPTRADDHETELQTYIRLETLQGRCIPHFFGEAFRNGRIPALVLEYIEGTPLHELPLEELASPRVLAAMRQGTSIKKIPFNDLPNPELLSALQSMYALLAENGVVHGDPQLHNFIRVEGGVVAVDFEFSRLLPDHVTNEEELEDLKDQIEALINKAAPSDPSDPSDAEMHYSPPDPFPISILRGPPVLQLPTPQLPSQGKVLHGSP